MSGFRISATEVRAPLFVRAHSAVSSAAQRCASQLMCQSRHLSSRRLREILGVASGDIATARCTTLNSYAASNEAAFVDRTSVTAVSKAVGNTPISVTRAALTSHAAVRTIVTPLTHIKTPRRRLLCINHLISAHLHTIMPSSISAPITSAKNVKGRGGGPPSLVSLALTQALTVENARTLIFYVVVYKYTLRLWRHLRSFGVTASIYQVYVTASRRLFALLLKVPAVKRKVNKELDQATRELEDKLAPRVTHIASNPTLPEQGCSRDWLMTELVKLQRMTAGKPKKSKEAMTASITQLDGEEDTQEDGQLVWRGGKLSGAVYHGGQEMSDTLAEAIKMFMLANPLHPDVFPGVRKMEAEVVSMVLRLYNAPETGAGTMTSGGTESILMACKAAREWGRHAKRITRPEIVLSRSAHAAFHKAGEYFGIKIVEVDVDTLTRKLKLSSMRRAINCNTIMVVGSAPCFGEGIIDDIDAIALLAKRSNVLCHVDCCLGSFLMPFLEKAGLPSAPFDFRIEGVTSISCDTHKYGFAPKGSSIVMYRTPELRRHQYYVQPDWSGGVYASPSIAGSRPGALVAGTWAALMMMGDDGYTASCKEIVGAARKIEKGIRDNIHQLRIMGRPMVSVVSFSSAGSVNIYEVGDRMSAKGWHLNGLATEPPAIHIACTKLTVPVVDEFLRDLKDAVKETKTRGPPGSMAQVYGLGSSSAVGPALVGEIASRFLDTLYLVR